MPIVTEAQFQHQHTAGGRHQSDEPQAFADYLPAPTPALSEKQ